MCKTRGISEAAWSEVYNREEEEEEEEGKEGDHADSVLPQ